MEQEFNQRRQILCQSSDSSVSLASQLQWTVTAVAVSVPTAVLVNTLSDDIPFSLMTMFSWLSSAWCPHWLFGIFMTSLALGDEMTPPPEGRQQIRGNLAHLGWNRQSDRRPLGLRAARGYISFLTQRPGDQIQDFIYCSYY